MKNHRVTRLSQLLAILSLTFLGLAHLHAEECPDSSPEDPQLRRKFAKEWFSNAENAENNSDYAEAVRAYACSYKMVAHPFTAYNLGRVAERAENFELSLKMYKAYLALKPDAADKAEVADKVKVLEEKLKEPAVPPVAVEPTEPEPTTPAVIDNPPPEPITPPPVRLDPPPPPRGDVEDGVGSSGTSTTLAWIVGGVSVASLVGGIALNVSSRNKMSSCRENADKGNLLTANDSCNAAVPLAYMSYAMFGVAAAGAVVDGILIWRATSKHKDDGIEFGLNLLPGGAGLRAHGRF
jgi:tetratricopeptide (TPR) repeat protein